MGPPPGGCAAQPLAERLRLAGGLGPRRRFLARGVGPAGEIVDPGASWRAVHQSTGNGGNGSGNRSHHRESQALRRCRLRRGTSAGHRDKVDEGKRSLRGRLGQRARLAVQGCARESDQSTLEAQGATRSQSAKLRSFTALWRSGALRIRERYQNLATREGSGRQEIRVRSTHGFFRSSAFWGGEELGGSGPTRRADTGRRGSGVGAWPACGRAPVRGGLGLA